jgi:antitoxin component of RelBE/YafQ-DinJ toxin-antitoxin module
MNNYTLIRTVLKLSKVALNITVDEKVLSDFKKLCNEKDIKVSTKINSLMRHWIEENGEDTE